MPHPTIITRTPEIRGTKKCSTASFEELDEEAVRTSQINFQSAAGLHFDVGVANQALPGKQSNADLEEIIASSMQYFGTAVAPWPTSRARIEKDLETCRIDENHAEDKAQQPAAPTAIFLTSQYDESEETGCRSASTPPIPAPTPSVRRSRRLSLTKVNEELHSLDGRLCYERLEPVPIVTSPPMKAHVVSKPRKPTTHQQSEAQAQPSHSRIHSFFSFIYSRNAPPKHGITSRKTTDASEMPAPDLKGLFDPNSTYYNPESALHVPLSILKSARAAMESMSKSSKRAVRFENEVKVCETFAKDDYSRESVEYVARQLTPALALAIKKELNAIKQDMDVHDESRENTQFYFIK